MRTLEELHLVARPGQVVQPRIDSGLDYAVSIRVITVRGRVCAAGVFFRRDALRSNLSRGANAIALTGHGRRLRLSSEERWVLERIGIDPDVRAIPEEVRRMAARVGRHHARRGVQMIGQDYIVDARGRWWFVEVNLWFGIRLFAVTDGCGMPERGVMAAAGHALARTLEKVWAPKRASVPGPPPAHARRG